MCIYFIQSLMIIIKPVSDPAGLGSGEQAGFTRVLGWEGPDWANVSVFVVFFGFPVYLQSFLGSSRWHSLLFCTVWIEFIGMHCCSPELWSFWLDLIFFFCVFSRNLSAIQDREICCYSISCKEKDNIGEFLLQFLCSVMAGAPLK